MSAPIWRRRSKAGCDERPARRARVGPLKRAELRVAGELVVPGDKSISHRALICSALAEGTSRVPDILPSADVRSTAAVLRTLGVEVPTLSASLEIVGRGRRSLRSPSADLDCGNSG